MLGASKLLWDFLNYSSFFVVVLDQNMNIILGNYCLAKFFGYQSEEDIIGRNWKDFLPYQLRSMMSHIHQQVLKDDETYREFTSEIKNKLGEVLPVKWFNSKLGNGDKGTFSIGIPLTKPINPEENIDNIRTYMRDIVTKDAQTLDAIKDMVFKRNED